MSILPESGSTLPAQKFCPLCEKEKPTKLFRKTVRRPDGLYPCCRPCERKNRSSSNPKKWCPLCELWKEKQFFNKSKSRSDGLCAFCVECGRAKQRDIHKKDPDLMRSRHFARTYGISIEEYNALFQSQKGLCLICERPESGYFRGEPKRLAIDHCHETGKVRGLLCSNCNRGIGFFQEDKKRMLSAIQYLEKNKNRS